MIDRIKYKNGVLKILDQRLLPGEIKYATASSPEDVAAAILAMTLRGAPLIGCAAAYGFAASAHAKAPATWKALSARFKRVSGVLKNSRPTAVALAYAVDRLSLLASEFIESQSCPRIDGKSYALLSGLLDFEADAIFREDVDADEKLSVSGARMLGKNSVVMTHCNAGALATAGIGTALGVIKKAHEQGKIKNVYACETRPYLQGSRLTMWELMREKIPSSLITDNMAAHIMKTCGVDAVIVGADRIAANGDTANKIGTYSLAIAAAHHKIPFYVAAPVPTIDLRVADGSRIPIEERDPEEVCEIRGIRIAPKHARARHPAFDVTPASLITALITEKGIIKNPTSAKIKKLLA